MKGESSVKWKISNGKAAILILIAGLLFPLETRGAEVQITIEGGAAAKVYGQPDCQTDEKITFTWKFTPNGQVSPTQSATYKIILGSNDPKTGVVLLEGKLDLSNINTNNTTGGYEVKGSFGGIPDSNSEDSTKGMIEDGLLTVRDIIGYYRVSIEQKGSIDPKKLCQLEAPAKGGEKSVELYVVAEYSVLDTTGTGTTRKQDAEGVLNVTFDLTPPPAPEKPQVFPGEKKIEVRWKANKDNTYDVALSDKPFDPKSGSPKIVNSTPISGESFVIDNLSPKTKYYIAIRAYDKAGNPSEFSPVVSTSTVELLDFYEAYRSSGGKDRGFSGGSYCFIATAAYGDPDHPIVKTFREFRDRVLVKYSLGKSFIRWYYRTSPPIAKELAKSVFARWTVRMLLYPLAGLAWLWLHFPLALWAIFIFFAAVTLRKKLTPFLKKWSLFGILLICSFGLPPSPARAESPRNFSLELRAGPYLPQIDSEFKGAKSGPYKSFFNTSMPYLELGLEWLFFKEYGSLGLSGTFGASWAIAPAKNPDGTPAIGTGQSTNQTDGGNSTQTVSSNNTSLIVLPLRLELIYRFDYFAVRSNFPLVPYLRGGIDYYLWMVTNSSGGLARYTDSSGKEDQALGGRLGFHFGLGVQFLLNILDPIASRSFDVEVGVNYTYLFFEWNFSWIGVVSPGLNLSDSSFRAGLLFQF